MTGDRRLARIERRIEQLERRERWYRRGGATIGLLVVAGLLAGAARPNVGAFDSVLTKSLHVLNYDGKEVCTLATNETGNGFMVIANGYENAVLYAGNKDDGDGGALTLYNRTGQGVVQLAVAAGSTQEWRESDTVESG